MQVHEGVEFIRLNSTSENWKSERRGRARGSECGGPNRKPNAKKRHACERKTSSNQRKQEEEASYTQGRRWYVLLERRAVGRPLLEASAI